MVRLWSRWALFGWVLLVSIPISACSSSADSETAATTIASTTPARAQGGDATPAASSPVLGQGASAVPTAARPPASVQRTATTTTAQATTASAGGPPATNNLALILDASGSMLNQIGGRTRLAIAQDAVIGLSTALPSEVRTSLWAYGHRLPDTDKEASCRDIEELIALGPVDRVAFGERVQGIAALGWTPIGDSMIAAAGVLPAGPAQRNTLVVVSDGLETCGSDVCAVAASLIAANRSLTIHTIGFDVVAEVRAELECVATAGNGRYFAAGDAGTLIDALVQAASPAQSGSAFKGIEAEVITPEPSGPNAVYTIDIRARHPGGTALALEWNPLAGTVSAPAQQLAASPDWVNASVRWDLSTQPVGSYTMTLRVSDGTEWIGKSITVAITSSTVGAAVPNAAPVLVDVTRRQSGPPAIFKFSITVRDPEGDPVKVEWRPFVGKVSADSQALTGTSSPQTSTVDWDLSQMKPGQYSMNIRVSDGSRTFGVQVSATITN